MRRYLEILRTPHVGALFAASLLARLPMGINGLASGLGAPLTARLIDRLGARTLLALAGLSAAGMSEQPSGVVANPDGNGQGIVDKVKDAVT